MAPSKPQDSQTKKAGKNNTIWTLLLYSKFCLAKGRPKGSVKKPKQPTKSKAKVKAAAKKEKKEKEKEKPTE